MITLQLEPAVPGAASVLALGAHPDDIEIAAGGALLSLAERYPGLCVRYVLLTGTPERQQELASTPLRPACPWLLGPHPSALDPTPSTDSSPGGTSPPGGPVP